MLYAVVFLPVVAQFRVAAPEIYYCSTADGDDAQILCRHAHPGAKVLYVAEGYSCVDRVQVLHEFFRETVEVGSRIYRCGPPNDPRSGICTYQGPDASGKFVRLEADADQFEAPVSEIAILPGQPEDNIARLQTLASHFLGLAQGVISAATRKADTDIVGSPVGQLLDALSEAEQCLSELGVSDLESSIPAPFPPTKRPD